jgi:hypothetical protein
VICKLLVQQLQIVLVEKGEDGFQVSLDARYYPSELNRGMIPFVNLLFLEYHRCFEDANLAYGTCFVAKNIHLIYGNNDHHRISNHIITL